MASITLNISGGVAPYIIKVTRVGETTDRFISYSGGVLQFTAETINQSIPYNIYVKDQGICDSTVSFQLNCYTPPNPSTVLTVQPRYCNPDNSYSQSTITLSNTQNMIRYKICYNQTNFENCGNCLDSTGLITGSSQVITLETPTTPNAITSFIFRGYADNSCTNFFQFLGSVVTPECTPTEVPNFTSSLQQPYCSLENVLQPAKLTLTNIVNATRYKICYGLNTFNCGGDCAISDGTITGSTKEITLTSPAAGQDSVGVVRIYNGATCGSYKDIVFNLHSPNCNEVTVAFIDLQTNANNSSFDKVCDNPATYKVTYDFYAVINTPGLESLSGQIAKVGGGVQRNLPNGNDVPNVYISAALKASCAQGANAGSSINAIFYRFGFNLSALRANFPSVSSYSFDIYGVRTKSDATNARDNIFVTKSAFTGVAMIKQLHANDSVDAYRFPAKIGSTVQTSQIYNPNISGNRKIGTLNYNYNTNTLTWVPA